MSSYGNIIRDGLWHNNPATVQVLGLCPLLAVTSTVVNSLGLGIATTIVLILTNVTISLIRKLVRPEIRMPVFVLVIAAAVTIAQLIIQAYFYQLYLIIGLYVALITTNCVIMARAEAFASKNTVFASALDGLFMGLGGTIVLVALGAMREVIGYGTLFQQFDLLFGHAAKAMEITVIPHYHGFLLAILPPGAFIGLGLLIALKNIIDARREQAQALAGTQTAT